MVAARADNFDLAGLRLSAGEGRHLELEVWLDAFELGGERYSVLPPRVPVLLDVSKMSGGGGYSLRLRFSAQLEGPCMRCLAQAGPRFALDAREVAQAGGGEQLESPYVEDGVLDLGGWARDILALALPAQILCRSECAGLCAICGTDLNEAGAEHRHERSPDPRWAKLSELEFDS
jgi:uncharacterized protein